ncbi:hypothetical protein HMPREF9509_00069 [Enterococcus faecalis TX0411]|nr:hypothetical protein HMPREF9509_00069 [Enterococcus faecalis TX0411]
MCLKILGRIYFFEKIEVMKRFHFLLIKLSFLYNCFFYIFY